MSSESIRVLLVEDSISDADMIYEGLEEDLPGQFQMTHVKRLSEALEHLWKEPCDVVLLDLGLPDSHGIDTLVLARAQAPAVPIVVLTGFQDEAAGDQALKEGRRTTWSRGKWIASCWRGTMRCAIARMVAAKALIGQQVALAEAGALIRSRQRLISTHERVRREAAAQLRDCVQEKLTLLKGHQQEFVKAIGPMTKPARLLSDAIDGLGRSIEQHVGDLIRQLYPSNLGEGLAAAFQPFRDRFGGALDLEIGQDEGLLERGQAALRSLPEPVGLAAYRIAEEALTNVVEHAKASKVAVRVDSTQEGWMRLTVRDNGQGFDVNARPRGPGMGTMQDYAEAVNGECSVRSDPGAGTEVTAVLPISRPGAEKLVSSEKGAY